MGLSIFLLVLIYCGLYILKTWNIFDIEGIKANKTKKKKIVFLKKETKDDTLSNIFNKKIYLKGKESCVIHFNG